MLLPPIVLSIIWLVVVRLQAQGRADAPPLAPTTTAGRLALASVALHLLLLVEMSLLVAVPVGVVMLALWAFARWARRDRGALLALPLVFGLWTLLVPLFFE